MKNTHNSKARVQAGRLKNLLKNMVDIYSPSGKEEEITSFLYRYLRKHHLKVIKQKVDKQRYNLIIMPREHDEIDLCFVGHLDTVTAYDLDDYRFSEKGDTISGLGTADMKAGCAAMIEAFIVLSEMGESLPPVGLALVVDEEENNEGVRALINEYDFPWAVIGEPTNMIPCLNHYSYLEVLLRTRGKRAHSAMPEYGQNAIESMLKLLLKIVEYTKTTSQRLVCNIRELTSFPEGFIVADICEAWLDLHLPPDSKIDTLKTELQQLIEDMKAELPELNADLRFEDTYSGYRISQERPVVETLRKVYEGLSMPWEFQDFRSHSDGNILWSAGVNPIILGPGLLEAAHTPEEAVSFENVVQAAEVYLQFALSLSDGKSTA
ncbi:MAG: M20/M25/M40 family metallo-hydrolase [Dehalococcoidales bacterium]|nr:MAG: M20/M25/M40 family metallo-hydrolase [Dehalococcoidales bacterium]